MNTAYGELHNLLNAFYYLYFYVFRGGEQCADMDQ
ncbi:MAG: hypothetical protein V7641_2099 [Blastocatellia bacterium]